MLTEAVCPTPDPLLLNWSHHNNPTHIQSSITLNSSKILDEQVHVDSRWPDEAENCRWERRSDLGGLKEVSAQSQPLSLLS